MKITRALDHPPGVIREHVDWWEPRFDDRPPLGGGAGVEPSIGLGLDGAALARYRA